MAVESSEGLCSPGQGNRANDAFVLNGAADRRPKGAPQAATHQTLKDLHWEKGNMPSL